MFVDYRIFAEPYIAKIEKAMCKIKQHFNITEEGKLTIYLGVNVQFNEDGTSNLTQPHLI